MEGGPPAQHADGAAVAVSEEGGGAPPSAHRTRESQTRPVAACTASGHTPPPSKDSLYRSRRPSTSTCAASPPSRAGSDGNAGEGAHVCRFAPTPRFRERGAAATDWGTSCKVAALAAASLQAWEAPD